MAWIQTNWAVIATALLGVSEVLALVPAIKANSIFQLILNFLTSSTKPPTT